jgi:peptide/nickel transport system substrate-binding protein
MLSTLETRVAMMVLRTAMRLRVSHVTTAVVAVLALALAACSSGGGTTGTAALTPQRGGTLHYLVSGVLSSWDMGLDPATAGDAPSIYEDAIFGQLFRLTPSGGIQPVLASGYKVSDGGTVVTISLRPGVKFSDGTPFNAQAVVWNIDRDLAADCVCSPVTSWPPLARDGVTAPNATTVVLRFTRPYAAVINAIITSSVNHIASPTAVRKMGEKQFALTPVGAGPFEVVSNDVDNVLTLKRYPGYWQKGRPYLNGLVFDVVSDDETTYEALEAGSGQAGQMTTPAIISEAQRNPGLSVMATKGTSPSLIQLNTAIPPFNNKLAREAIYYATDAQAISAHLLDNMFPTAESFLGPGGLFYQPTVPGYPSYNLAKAKQIVSSLGGLSVSLFGPNDPVSTEILDALRIEWEQAGIHVTVSADSLDAQIQAFDGKHWQAALGEDGAFDPAVSAGLAFRFASTAQFSGVHDPVLDTMMAQAAATFNASQRAARYANIAKYIASQAYAPFLVTEAPVAVTAKGVYGPGLTSSIPVPSVVISPYWDEVWIGKG